MIGLGRLRHIKPSKISSGVWNKQPQQWSVQLEIGATSAKHKQVSYHHQGISENG